jgi:hypothetical protein
MKAYWQASYRVNADSQNKTPGAAIGLADGKQWMEMLERGESVLDGLVR